MGRILGIALLLVSPLLAAHGTAVGSRVEPRLAVSAGRLANIPTWTEATARRFPGCDTRRRLGDVVFVDQQGVARRLGFDHAWALTHDHERGNDGWVVGWCG